MNDKYSSIDSKSIDDYRGQLLHEFYNQCPTKRDKGDYKQDLNACEEKIASLSDDANTIQQEVDELAADSTSEQGWVCYE